MLPSSSLHYFLYQSFPFQFISSSSLSRTCLLLFLCLLILFSHCTYIRMKDFFGLEFVLDMYIIMILMTFKGMVQIISPRYSQNDFSHLLLKMYIIKMLMAFKGMVQIKSPRYSQTMLYGLQVLVQRAIHGLEIASIRGF